MASHDAHVAMDDLGRPHSMQPTPRQHPMFTSDGQSESCAGEIRPSHHLGGSGVEVRFFLELSKLCFSASTGGAFPQSSRPVGLVTDHLHQSGGRENAPGAQKFSSSIFATTVAPRSKKVQVLPSMNESFETTNVASRSPYIRFRSQGFRLEIFRF